MELNQGVSLGVMVPRWLVWFSLGLVGVTWYRERQGGLLLVMIGGVANLISRLRYQGVVDNWQVGGFLYNNWADYLIVVGVVWYGYTKFRLINKSTNQKKQGRGEHENSNYL